MPKDFAILDMSNPKHRKMLVSHIGTLKGKHWVDIRRCRKQRTMSQNAYMWAVVYPAVKAGLEDAWGETLTVDDVHEWLRGRFNCKAVVNRATGEIKGRCPQSTASLDVSQFGEYLDKVIRFAGEELGVDVPTPDEYRNSTETHADELRENN